MIGISLGATLSFETAAGVSGLWWGLAAGLTCTAALGMTVLARTDWHDQVRRATQRVGGGEAGGGKAVDGGGSGGGADAEPARP